MKAVVLVKKQGEGLFLRLGFEWKLPAGNSDASKMMLRPWGGLGLLKIGREGDAHSLHLSPSNQSYFNGT